MSLRKEMTVAPKSFFVAAPLLNPSSQLPCSWRRNLFCRRKGEETRNVFRTRVEGPAQLRARRCFFARAAQYANCPAPRHRHSGK